MYNKNFVSILYKTYFVINFNDLFVFTRLYFDFFIDDLA